MELEIRTLFKKTADKFADANTNGEQYNDHDYIENVENVEDVENEEVVSEVETPERVKETSKRKPKNAIMSTEFIAVQVGIFVFVDSILRGRTKLFINYFFP